MTPVMAFRSRAKLFERRTSFLDRLRGRQQAGNHVMKVKTRNGDIKEINGNGVVIVGGHRDVDNKRIHKQASHFTVYKAYCLQFQTPFKI